MPRPNKEWEAKYGTAVVAMNKRPKLTPADANNQEAAVRKLANGVPESVPLLSEAIYRCRNNNWFLFLSDLDDMNIVGPLISYAYGYADQSIDSLLEAVRRRDRRMVRYVNEAAERDKVPDRAMVNGASLGNQAVPERRERSLVPSRR